VSSIAEERELTRARATAARHYEFCNTREETITQLAALLTAYGNDRLREAIDHAMKTAASYEARLSSAVSSVQERAQAMTQARALREYADRLQQLISREESPDRWKEPWGVWDHKKEEWALTGGGPMSRDFATDLAALYNRHNGSSWLQGRDDSRFQARPEHQPPHVGPRP